MPSEAFNMENVNPFEKLVALLISPEKAGKSRCASTARKPILFLDTDQRRQSVAGIPGVYAITFHDEPYPNQPTAAPEILDIITQLERSRRVADLVNPQGRLYFPDARQGLEFKTIVNDSITTHARAFMQYVLYANPIMRRTANIGGKLEVYSSKDFGGWNAEYSSVESVILREIAIPGLDVIATLHETMEEADDSTLESPKFTGKISVYPPRYKGIVKYFSEVWRISRASGTPVLQLIPNWNFEMSATNLGLTQEEVDSVGPNIVALIQKAIDLGRIKPEQVPQLST